MRSSSRGAARRLPTSVIELVKTVNRSLKLGQLLCRCRSPDFLLDIIKRQVMGWFRGHTYTCVSRCGDMSVVSLLEAHLHPLLPSFSLFPFLPPPSLPPLFPPLFVPLFSPLSLPLSLPPSPLSPLSTLLSPLLPSPSLSFPLISFPPLSSPLLPFPFLPPSLLLGNTRVHEMAHRASGVQPQFPGRAPHTLSL